MTPPRILALDFDGVVCDGRPEYFQTAWQAYVAAWPAPALTSSRPEKIAARFSTLRPLIESGWEMPLLVHALLAGVGDEALKDRHAWLAAAPGLMKPAGVSAEALGRALNKVRDDWFARDSAGWLAHHQFYPGVAGQIAALLGGPTEVVIVTTKDRGNKVALDGSASSDADAQRLKFFWSAPGVKLNGATSAKPVGIFPIGTTTVTLKVTDPAGKSDTDTVDVKVKLRPAPPPRGQMASEAFSRATQEATISATARTGVAPTA